MKRVLLILVLFSVGSPLPAAGPDRPPYRIATFSADVTPPLGHACMGGGIAPVKKIDDPLFAHGWVLLGAGKPVVFVAVDWCEIRNDAYQRWRRVLADAAETAPERVLVACLHQHDAPVADLGGAALPRPQQGQGEYLRPRLSRAGRAGSGSGTPGGAEEAEKSHAHRHRPGPRREGGVQPPLPPRRRQTGLRPHQRHPRPESARQTRRDHRPLAQDAQFLGRCYSAGGAELLRHASDELLRPGRSIQRLRRPRANAAKPTIPGCSRSTSPVAAATSPRASTTTVRPTIAPSLPRLYQGMTAAWKATKRYPLKEVDFRSTPLRRSRAPTPVSALRNYGATENGPPPLRAVPGRAGAEPCERADAGHVLDLPSSTWARPWSCCCRESPMSSISCWRSGCDRMPSWWSWLEYTRPGMCQPTRPYRSTDGNLRDWCWVAGAEKTLTTASKTVLQRR